MDHLRTTYNYCRAKLVSINLFKSQSTDPTKLYHEILSTRLFIILLGSSFIVLASYVSFSPQMIVEKIHSPSLSDYERIQKRYSDTLECLCTKISIPYYRFTNIEVSFHQVCSSNFTSQKWIDFLFESIDKNLWPMDVRTSLSAMWRLIRTLCDHSASLLYNAFFEFEVSLIVSSTVLSEEQIHINIEQAIKEIQQTASNAFLLPLTIIQEITQKNSFMTVTSVNYGINAINQSFEPIESVQVVTNKYLRKGSTDNCSCLHQESCPMSGSIYLYDRWDTDGFFDLNILVSNETLPGLVVNCLPLQIALTSSLECFYNQTCLDILLSTYSTKINVQILNESLTSRFLPLTTNIESIVRELFVEQLHVQINFHSYFNACAPIYCMYTRPRRFNWIYVVTTLIALYGGLNAALYIITPYLIDMLLFVKTKLFQRNHADQDENMRIHTLLWQWFHRLKVFIIEFNLFDNYSDEAIDIRRGRISTWLYLVLLAITMTIITVFNMKASYWKIVTIYSPSEKQYDDLYRQYPDTLSCPCTSTSNPHGLFVRFTLRQHQICESNFVQPWWYQSLKIVENNSLPLNSSIFISSYFRTLSMLCHITETTLKDAIRQFSVATFVSSHVRQKQFILLQTDQLFSVLKSSVMTEFNNIILLINEVFHTNQYISGQQTNVLLKKQMLNSSNQMRIVTITNNGYDDNGQPCYCTENPLCNIESFYGDSRSWTIPGLSFNCFVFDSVLKSSLICWYDIYCLNTMLRKLTFSNISTSTNISILDDKLPSRFLMNATIKFLLDHMMIEEWNARINYTAFYHGCYPKYCTYGYYDKYNVLYLIATMMGIFGGLDVILRIICLIFVGLLFRCRTTPNAISIFVLNTPDAFNWRHRSRQFFYNIWNNVRYETEVYNLFKSGSTQMHVIKRERYSTRLYLFLLSIGILIIIIYSVSSKEIITETIERPTLEMYKKLLKYNESRWRCPCSEISISYNQFIKINITFHQICFSDFVKESWLNLLFSNISSFVYESFDFRMIASAYFKFLSTLCTLAQTTKQNDIVQFLSEKSIGVQLMPIPLYDIVLADAMYQMKGPKSSRLTNMLRFVQNIAHGNTLISSYLLNWYWPLQNNGDQILIRAHAKTINNACSCGTLASCVQPAFIYLSKSNTSHWTIPGLNVGCSIIDTLLRSTLECLYNQTCVDLFQLFVRGISKRLLNVTNNITALDSMVHTRYPPHTNILQMSSPLFFEEGTIEISHVNFFKQCAPSHCSYTYEKYNNYPAIVSRILALWGGLTLSFGFIAPCVVQLWFKIISCRHRNRING